MLALKAFDTGISIGTYSDIKCMHQAGIALDADTIREALLTGLLNYHGVFPVYKDTQGNRGTYRFAAHYINLIEGCETFHIIRPEDGTFIGTVYVHRYTYDSVGVNAVKGVALLTSQRART